MTDREKQIEEMAKDICFACKTRHKCNNELCCMSKIVAEALINAGYRLCGAISPNYKHYQAECERYTRTAEIKQDLANESITKKVAQDILHELVNIMNAKCDDINSDELYYLANKYNVRID